MAAQSISKQMARRVQRFVARQLRAEPSTDRVRDTTDGDWDEVDASSLEVLRWAPCWMTTAERLFLYSLVFALRPCRYLEIGSFQGGSAVIVGAAMDASRNAGRMVCVDPEPRIEPEHWQRIQHRATLAVGTSPEILEEAQRAAGGPFDLVLVDGDHTHEGVRRDLDGLLDRLADRGHLVCHDGYHPGVARAIADFAIEHADRIVDLGLFTKDLTYVGEGDARSGPWGGLHLLQARPLA